MKTKRSKAYAKAPEVYLCPNYEHNYRNSILRHNLSILRLINKMRLLKVSVESKKHPKPPRYGKSLVSGLKIRWQPVSEAENAKYLKTANTALKRQIVKETKARKSKP